jgi:hypothetical protein
VSPALAGEKNQVRELHNFWFDGTHISAFNDILGIRMEFESDFEGGVNGNHLLGILEKSRARNVRLELDAKEDGVLVVKAGSATARLALMPISDMLWNPSIPKDEGYTVTKEFLVGVNRCLLSVGTAKVLTPEQRGVTLIQNTSEFNIYSTDAVSLSWVKLKGNSSLGEDERCIIPTEFCEQLKNLGPIGSKLRFDANSVYCDSAVLVAEVVDTTKKDDKDPPREKVIVKSLLFSALVEDEDVVDFSKHIAGYIKGKGNFTIPGGMKMSIDRAMVILDEDQPINLKVGKEYKDDDQKVVFIFATAEDQHGKINDIIDIKEEEDDHPEIQVRVDAKILKRGLDSCKYIMITNECVVMRSVPSEAFIHIVATK